MNENTGHMISRLRWDTAFDHKGKAVELQERISDWSGLNMQKEMAAIFDKLCPPEQTWKIQSLELDLGNIDFNNLEFELTVKLRQQLNEKLTELILYAHKRGQNIEILNEKRSHVQLIGYFLLHGLLPWNYQTADGSVNQILATQLHNNREQVIEMLRTPDLRYEQVRQRMAWQFNEPNMIKIIEGLEPNNGGQIIQFSNELTKVQLKETFVQATSTADFKKNLWLWVLNYLFTERGTVFNRVQFMKSSITQMAAHYNMQYNQLFELIELSVAKLSRNLSLQSDFINTLQLLSNENRSRKNKSYTAENELKDHWSGLTVLFRDKTLRLTAGKKAEFNDLIAVLSSKNKERFFALISSFGNAEDFWLPVINDLSDDTLKTVFSSLKATQSAVLTESILFLNQLMGGVQPNMERNLLWYKGLMFLQEHQNTSFGHDTFLHSLITILSRKKQLSKIAVLDQLMGAEVPYALKTLLNMEIYHRLAAVFMTEVSGTNTGLFKSHLQRLMEMFHHQLTTGIRDQKLLTTLQNTLEKYVRLHPKAVLEAFMATPYKNSLQQILPSFITGKNTEVLNTEDQPDIRLSVVERVTAIMLSGAGRQKAMVKILRFNFNDSGFMLWRRSEKAESGVLMNYLFTGAEQQMNILIKAYTDLLSTVLKRLTIKEIVLLLHDIYWKCLLDQAGETERTELLRSSFSVAVFSRFPVLIKVPGAVSLPGYVTGTDHRSAERENKETVKINDIRMEKDKNSPESSIQALDKLVFSKRPWSEEGTVLKEIPAEEEETEGLVKEDIPQAALDQLLKAEQKGLLDNLGYELICQQQVPGWFGSSDKQEIKDLLNGILIHYPETFLAVVKQEVITEPQLIWLNKMLNFNRLMDVIGYLNKPRKSVMAILVQFYGALGTIAVNGISAGEMQYILFKKVMRAWTAGNWKLISTENIWNELIWEVCTSRGVSKIEFLTRMDNGKLRFPPSLQLSLEFLIDQERSSRNTDKAAVSKALAAKFLTPVLKDKNEILKGGISVRNAGIVLVNSYLSMLLERLGLINDQKKFSSDESRLEAVHYLQYVVTGLEHTEESFLPLNKLLCGLSLSQPVKESIVISDDRKKLIDGLIKAAIGHWPVIGSCSVDGFRGNWLVRDGLLTEREDRWELTVEKRAYDLLIHKSPFSFSVIRYPWMDKPLHVNWPY